MLSLDIMSINIFVVSHFGFKGRSFVLIERVPGNFLPCTFLDILTSIFL